MIATSADVNSLMDSNYDKQHGVVLLQNVEKLLRERGVDVPETILIFCEGKHRWSLAATPILYSLAQRGELSEEQAMRLVPIFFSIVDGDEYYQSVSALSQQKYVKPTMEIFRRLFQQRDIHDWRWLGYYIINMLLYRKVEFKLPIELVAVVEEAYREEDLGRRNQLIACAQELVENQKSASS